MLTTSLAWFNRLKALEANEDLIKLTANEQLIGSDCRGKTLIPDKIRYVVSAETSQSVTEILYKNIKPLELIC